MKIIITYGSAGAGHFKAAKAIYDYLKEHCPAIELKLVDAIEESSCLFRFFYTQGYSFLIRHGSSLWWWAFWLTAFKALRWISVPITSFINRINTRGFANFLIQENPDFIISTHFLASYVACRLKKAKKIKSNLLTVITDFAVHPYWVQGSTDTYVVATEFTKEQLVAEGIESERIKDWGIPVEEKFLNQFDKVSLRKIFGIDENKFSALIMTGSFGIGPLGEIVDALYRDVQILVVCASNKKLYARLKSRNLSGVYVFGFVDNIQELMAASDIIITKPGGLTISEILCMELPPIFISEIPGQEAGNLAVLRTYGIGLSPKSIKEIKNTVLDLKEHPDKLKSIQENIKQIKKTNTLRKICNAVCQSSSGVTC